MRRAPRALLASLALVVAGGCQKEARPPAPPKKCAIVERGSDRVIEVVLCAEKDGDEDGVDDVSDLCPEHKELVNGIADKDGCPDPDRDQDLFVDYEDACPDEPGVAPDGCPGIDSDGDLIADHLDSCPHEKEDMDGDRDDDGCPDGERDESVAKALDEQLWQKTRVDVRRGRAGATKDGAVALEELARTVASRPADVTRVRIVGYAALRETRRGKARDLAKERVKLVEARLAQAGVKPQAFERAIYPLKDRAEPVGRVDVMVFLDLNVVMKGDGEAAKPVGGEPEADAGGPAKTPPTDPRPAAPKEPAKQKAPSPSDEEWDAKVIEPFVEPEKPAADEDWDL